MSGAAPAAEAASFQNALFAADYDVVLSKLRGGAKVSKAMSRTRAGTRPLDKPGIHMVAMASRITMRTRPKR